MVQFTVEEAAGRLAQIVEEVPVGEEIVLTKNNLPIARLVPILPVRPHPRRGSARGMNIYIADDFDAPLDEFE